MFYTENPSDGYLPLLQTHQSGIQFSLISGVGLDDFLAGLNPGSLVGNFHDLAAFILPDGQADASPDELWQMLTERAAAAREK